MMCGPGALLVLRMSSVVLVTYLYLGHVAVGVAEASIFMPTRRTNAQVSASGALTS